MGRRKEHPTSMAHSLYSHSDASAETPAAGESKMDFLQGAQSKCECALLLSLHYYTANSWRSSVQTAHLPGQNLHCSDVHRREGERVAGRRIAAASTDVASPGVWGSSDGANLSHKATVVHWCCLKCHKRCREDWNLFPLRFTNIRIFQLWSVFNVSTVTCHF